MKFSVVVTFVFVLLACVLAVSAEEVIREFDWAKFKKAGEIQSNDQSGPKKYLKIDGSKADSPKTVMILDVTSPGVTTFYYAVEGTVRYEDVKGIGYLEMWSEFSDGSQYFSRTLADLGALQNLQGSSDWRPFSLPFTSDVKNGYPKRLIVNVVLPGRGTVNLSPLKLVQYPSLLAEQSQLRNNIGWWSDRDAGWIGGIGGSVVGLLGALLGILGGLGKARRFVIATMFAMIGLGVLSLIVGLIALAIGQPYAVYYPLLLLGLITTAVYGGNLPGIRRRYEQIELRKMAVMDAR